MSLVGKFFLVSRADHYRTGEIVLSLTPELYLVKFDWNEQPGPMELFHTTQMVDCHSEGSAEKQEWGFFDSREQLDAWIKWLDAPAKPQITHIVKDKK